MKDDSARNNEYESKDDTAPSRTTKNRNKQNQKPTNHTNGPKKRKKKPFLEVFRSYSRVKQAEFVLGSLIAFGGIGYLIAYVTVSIEQNISAKAENRPHVIISRPPVIYGSFSCQVTDKAIHSSTGPMRFFIKEIGGKANAANAYITGTGQSKLVVEKKVGNPAFDDPPVITDQICKTRIGEPTIKMVPVYAGQETQIDSNGSVGTISLVKTKSVTLTLGSGPPVEPEAPPGEKPDITHIAQDAAFQFYIPLCVYYSDRDGTPYGNCRMYRFVIGGNGLPGSGRDVFACTETPIAGSFQATIGSFCDN